MSKNTFEINNKLKYVLSTQLQKRKEELGYKTVDDFINALTKKYSFKYSAVRSWYYGSTLPDIGKLYDLCDFLDCDIDYLFGRIECSTHAYQRMKKETSLTEKAIFNLINDIPIPIKSLLPDTKVKPLSAAVNFLLTDENGVDLLRHIFDYMHPESLVLSYKDQQLKGDINIHSTHSNNSYTLSPISYDSILLGQIQEDLILLKKSKKK